LIHVVVGKQGRSFGDLLAELGRRDELALGLYRTRVDDGHLRRYVVTCPSADVEIDASDMVYILSRFGEYNTLEMHPLFS